MLAIASDHAGFALKEALKPLMQTEGILFEDFGCHSEDSVDYPDYAHLVAERMHQQPDRFPTGLLICGSGVGICIAANRHPDIQAVVVHDLQTAQMSRRHNNANIICFGGRVIATDYAMVLLKAFLATPFDGGRHAERVARINPDSQSIVSAAHGAPTC